MAKLVCPNCGKEMKMSDEYEFKAIPKTCPWCKSSLRPEKKETDH